MNCYQKFYTNQIHSSSLLCQLATMWRSQVLCDAIIKSGPINIKAHRVVLVAACPMLQSMENASIGSHLEVRLASDIKKESINTFLQYLYEGFMLLTEDNCKDVEKIGRLLQVDSVIKCCADFYKCLSDRTGAVDLNEQYRFNAFNDNLEYRHVRSSEMLKSTQDRMLKRPQSFSQPSSPGSKRQRYHGPAASTYHTVDDTVSMSQSYASGDSWDRVPPGRGDPTGSTRSGSTGIQPGVIDIVEDSLELVQTEPPGTVNLTRSEPRQAPSPFSVGVSSKIDHEKNVQVVNISEKDDSSTQPPRHQFSMTPPIRKSPVPKSTPTLARMSDPQLRSSPVSDKRPPLGATTEPRGDNLYMSPLQSLSRMKAPSSSSSSATSSSSSSKPYALGSPVRNVAETSRDSKEKEDSRADKSASDQRLQPPDQPGHDLGHDVTVVKIEQEDPDLEMYVGAGEDGAIRVRHVDHDDSTNDEDSGQMGEWGKEEGNVSGAHDGSWMMDQSQYSGHGTKTKGSYEDYYYDSSLTEDRDLSDDPNKRFYPYEPKIGRVVLVEDEQGVPMLYVDAITHRFPSADAPFPIAGREVESLSHENFTRLVQMIGTVDVRGVHFLEGLGGKQKSCVLCKFLGSRTNEGLTAVRTRAKCKACDIALCRGSTRNCFKIVHQLLKALRYPDLKF